MSSISNISFPYHLLWFIVLLISKFHLLTLYLDSFNRQRVIHFSAVLALSQFIIACSSTPASPPQKGPTIQHPTTKPSAQKLSRSTHLSAALQSAYSVPVHVASRISPLIIQNADLHGVSPYLLAAVIQQESSYQSRATSPAGAVGLTQVMPKYWKNKCPGDLYQDTLNIRCGTAILSTYNKSAGNWSKALAYYNVGPSGYHSNTKMKKQGEKYARSVQQHHQNLINSIEFQPIPDQQAVSLERLPQSIEHDDPQYDPQ